MVGFIGMVSNLGAFYYGISGVEGLSLKWSIVRYN